MYLMYELAERNSAKAGCGSFSPQASKQENISKII